MKSISLILPAFNEADIIQTTLSAILSWKPPDDHEIHEVIVVDDGSRDDTADITSKIKSHDKRIKLLANKHNMGKGFSIRKGVLASRGHIIGFTDADQAYSPKMFNQLIETISSGETDIAIGTRFKKNKTHIPGYSLKRKTASYVFRKCIKALNLIDVSDPQCGLKFFSRHVADKVFPLLSCDRFVFDVEFLYISRLLGFQIMEIPVQMHRQTSSSISIFTEMPRVIIELLQIKRKRGIIPSGSMGNGDNL